MEENLDPIAQQTADVLKAKGLVLVTAESCTGGWVATAMTDIPGSSEWFERGFVTYSDTAKQEMLGVSLDTLRSHGAVSEATVKEMVAGALERSQAQVALSISGIAGPGGGTPDKPVGTVCFGWAVKDGEVTAELKRFGGDRRAVRAQSVAHALQGVIRVLGD